MPHVQSVVIAIVHRATPLLCRDINWYDHSSVLVGSDAVKLQSPEFGAGAGLTALLGVLAGGGQIPNERIHRNGLGGDSKPGAIHIWKECILKSSTIEGPAPAEPRQPGGEGLFEEREWVFVTSNAFRFGQIMRGYTVCSVVVGDEGSVVGAGWQIRVGLAPGEVDEGRIREISLRVSALTRANDIHNWELN